MSNEARHRMSGDNISFKFARETTPLIGGLGLATRVKTFLRFITILMVFATIAARAQGTFYLSNLGEHIDGNAPLGNNQWAAQSFTTGTSSGDYKLESVQLSLNGMFATSSNELHASLYTDKRSFPSSTGLPGSSLTPLTGPNPSVQAVYTYNGSVLLSPSTTYWIVLTSTQPAVPSFLWLTTDSANFSANDGWSINAQNTEAFSNDGQNWSDSFHLNTSLLFAVNATPVPEPSSVALIALGILVCRAEIWKRKA